MNQDTIGSAQNSKRRARPVVGPKLRRLLLLLLLLFSLLLINSVYLATLSLMEHISGELLQDTGYQFMFLAHLALGILIVLPVIIYGVIHWHNAHHRPNRRAIAAGMATFVLSIMVLISGFLLMRGFPWAEINHPDTRRLVYWLHVIAPLLAIWLFVLHRLAGKRFRLRPGMLVTATCVLAVAVTVWMYRTDQNADEEYITFEPALTRLVGDSYLDPDFLMDNDFCAECHADVHESWQASAHHLASFNNPAYEFSVGNSRKAFLQRDGDVNASRFCAACHDLVPMFTGQIDDPEFGLGSHPSAEAGITCMGCHGIVSIDGNRGNGQYTFAMPDRYPFADADSSFLAWINRTAIKGKPAMHKQSLLKPVHREAEFCGTCHKVALTTDVNDYHWLRGQNHYDAYQLSGVSGHGITSFYYPPEAVDACQDCHMKTMSSDDFGAFEELGELRVHDHQFAAANTAIPMLKGFDRSVLSKHDAFLSGSVTLDLIALREGGEIDGELLPLPSSGSMTLEPGSAYLLEMVVRTKTLGHIFTQGTADSNQVWLELEAIDANGVSLGHSGLINEETGQVDPWSHFINAYVIDRNGDRIDQREAEDIFTVLYNHQIPPGAADVVHYRLELPEQLAQPVTIKSRLRYRKFDTTYFRLFSRDQQAVNTLPVIDLDHSEHVSMLADSEKPEWMRWNDYGIGLLRKPGKGQLRQAEEAFRRVVELGRVDGYINLSRVYLREGRLTDAAEMLSLASADESLAVPWTVTWLSAQVDEQNGFFAEAIERYQSLVDTQFTDARERGFDFSQDYRLQERLANAWFERARQLRRRPAEYTQALEQSRQVYQKVLSLDSERASAHYGLSQVFTALGEETLAGEHRRWHSVYKIDDNARDRAIAEARRKNPIADHVADDVVIYPLTVPDTDDTMLREPLLSTPTASAGIDTGSNEESHE